MSTGFDPDHVGGKTASSLSRTAGVDRCRNSTEFDKPIDGEDTDAAAIGQDRQPLSRRRFDPPQRLGAVEQLAKIRYPQDPGATERGVIDRVRAGQRAGVGRGGLCPLRHAAGFDDDDRLDPGGRTRRGHELAGVLDRFDIEQDGVRPAVQREVIQADRRYRRRAGRRWKRSRKSLPRVAPPNPPSPWQWRPIEKSAPDFPQTACARRSSH